MAIQPVAVINLRKGREASLLRKHPWVFSGAIESISGSPQDGDWVTVVSSDKKTIGAGHYQKGTIAVRILRFGESFPDLHFYPEKIKVAFDQRRATGVFTDKTNAFRLVHGEGDGLPGLIVDYYHGVAVVQAHSRGYWNDRELLLHALTANAGAQTIYFQPAYGKNTEKGSYLHGLGAVPHVVAEHGHKFLVDWETGQKTGFFLDQRDNRNLLSTYAHGRKVVNTFCYTGGFSVYALAAGASLVHSVDASEKAVDMTRKNLALNGFDPQHHACYTEDTFEFLKDKKDSYDLIILDPPAFAKHKDAKHQAMKGYQRLNAEAMRMVRSGGIIFTFSCSQVVDRQLFYDTIISAGIQSGREVQVLHHLSQGADHPVSLFHPEGEYLKGLVLFVR